jgi:hypothetical protein
MMDLGSFFADLKRRNVYNPAVDESDVLNRNKLVKPLIFV